MAAADAVHKPSRQLADPKELLLAYLDYYRSVITRKIEGLTESELRTSRLPSGWTPLELIKHLAYMEQRWLRWGFMAEQIPSPHGDQDQAGRWHVRREDTSAELIAEHQDVVEVGRRDALGREPRQDLRAMLAGVGQDLQQPVARGNREIHPDVEASCKDVRGGGLDGADEALTDVVEVPAHPGEVVRFVVFGRFDALARFALDHGQVEVLDTGEVGEGALDRAARAGGLGLEQARFHVLCQAKHALVGPGVVAVEVDQLLHAGAGYRMDAAIRRPGIRRERADLAADGVGQQREELVRVAHVLVQRCGAR